MSREELAARIFLRLLDDQLAKRFDATDLNDDRKVILMRLSLAAYEIADLHIAARTPGATEKANTDEERR